MAFAGYPFLEPEPEHKFASLTAEEVMASEVVSLQQVETAERVASVLATTTHHAFPVVDGGEEGGRRFLNGMVPPRRLEQSPSTASMNSHRPLMDSPWAFDDPPP